MAEEREIKLRIADLAGFLTKLERLGAKPVGSGSGRVWEQNILFDTPQGGLAKRGQLLRVRVETPEATGERGPQTGRVVITFKQPVRDQGRDHKVREEIEVQASDPESLSRIFAGLGMAGWFRYEKYRTTYRLAARWGEGLLIELDETPIGAFVELEGPAGAIDRAAEELGYGKGDYILKSYLALYVEECRRHGQKPQNMTFPAKPLGPT